MFNSKENLEEKFDIVNKNDEIIKVGLKESELHINNDITRVVTTYIFDNIGCFYIAQRSPNKVVDPLKYEAPSHGKVNSGELYDLASERETKEELGVEIIKHEEVSHYYTSFDTNVGIRQHYKKIFIGYVDDEINICENEIHRIKKFENINEFFTFYKENTYLFSNAIGYDIPYLEKYFK